MTVNHKVGIVTGAGGGIGRAISFKLARQGMRLVLADVEPRGIEALARELEQAGGHVMPCCMDVGEERDVRSCLDRTIAHYGRVDALVNNAGISPKKPDGVKASLTEISLAEWEQVMKVNLTSVFLMCSASIPHMVRQGGGVIVSISSSAALDGGVLAAAHYTASKGAVSAMTRTLAKELAPQGIRVNAVAPGRVATPMAKLSSAERNQAALGRDAALPGRLRLERVGQQCRRVSRCP